MKKLLQSNVKFQNRSFFATNEQIQRFQRRRISIKKNCDYWKIQKILSIPRYTNIFHTIFERKEVAKIES